VLEKDLQTKERVENADGGGTGLDRFVIDGEDDRTEERLPIPDRWHVSGVHVGAADDYKLHAVSISRVFVKWAQATDERSTSWNRKFGKLLELIGSGMDPDAAGFSNSRGALYEYAIGKNHDWWEKAPYNFGAYSAAMEARKDMRLARTGSW
jgi:hypothetical protein